MPELALNIIVGPNESFELNRCLESVVEPGVFDEIVIVNTSKDEAVTMVAKEYTDKVLYFKWVNDFAKARNFAIDNTESSHIMWLDADDTMDKVSRSRLIAMKKYLFSVYHDIFLVPYKLDPDKNEIFRQTMPRERIFKNKKDIRWKYKVHEQLQIGKNKIAAFNGVAIEHRSTKLGNESLVRNISILREGYKKHPTNPHYIFYLARDLGLMGEHKEAIPLFTDVVDRRVGTKGNLLLASLEIALYYIYKGDGSLSSDTLDLGETYTRVAMSFSETNTCLHAEPYVLLGDIYHYRGYVQKAINLYKIAMSKQLNGKALQQVDFYEKIPSERLSRISEESEDFDGLEQALYYNIVALKHGETLELRSSRKRLIKKIVNKEIEYDVSTKRQSGTVEN